MSIGHRQLYGNTWYDVSWDTELYFSVPPRWYGWEIQYLIIFEYFQ
jgi:hypothetical protein